MMTSIKYLKNQKREIYELLNYEKTILESLFLQFGDLEFGYDKMREFLKRKHRIKTRDVSEFMDIFINLNYMSKTGGKRSLTLRICKEVILT